MIENFGHITSQIKNLKYSLKKTTNIACLRKKNFNKMSSNEDRKEKLDVTEESGKNRGFRTLQLLHLLARGLQNEYYYKYAKDLQNIGEILNDKFNFVYTDDESGNIVKVELQKSLKVGIIDALTKGKAPTMDSDGILVPGQAPWFSSGSPPKGSNFTQHTAITKEGKAIEAKRADILRELRKVLKYITTVKAKGRKIWNLGSSNKTGLPGISALSSTLVGTGVIYGDNVRATYKSGKNK